MLSFRKDKANQEGRLAAPSFAFVLRTILIGLFLGLLAGCDRDVKIDEHFVDTFIELRLVEFARNGGDLPVSRLERQEVLKRNGYTREQFLKKIDVLMEDEDQWVPFMKAVNARLDSMLVVKNDNAVSPSVPKGGPDPRKTPPRTLKGAGDD